MARRADGAVELESFCLYLERFECDFDDRGNWVREAVWRADAEDAASPLTLRRVTWRAIEYYP